MLLPLEYQLDAWWIDSSFVAMESVAHMVDSEAWLEVLLLAEDQLDLRCIGFAFVSMTTVLFEKSVCEVARSAMQNSRHSGLLTQSDIAKGVVQSMVRSSRNIM